MERSADPPFLIGCKIIPSAYAAPRPWPPGMVGPISNTSRHLKVDLRSAFFAARHTQLAAEFCCTLAHARQTPVPRAMASLEDRLINAITVISHRYMKRSRLIPNLHCNVLAPGVGKTIRQSLTAYQQYFFLHNAVQRPRPTNH